MKQNPEIAVEPTSMNLPLNKNLPPSKPRHLPNANSGESALIYIDADVYQAATLNVMLPKGFKIE